MPTDKCYDILLIGSFGMGKSTAGNKLLKINPQSIPFTPEGDEAIQFFVTKGGPTSTTQYCKLLPKESSEVRVMDTPGFSDSHGRELSNYDGNLYTFHKILLSQRDNGIAFSRVLYFLPQRGPLHRADGRLQEEIKLMYDFFDKAIFNVMVVVATNPQDSCYQIEFSEEDMKLTKDAFVTAFKNITDDNLPKCPPILYLPVDETDLLSRVTNAPVLHDTALHLETRDERCAKCSIILTYTSAKNKKVLIGAQNEITQTTVPIDESKCHPHFISKYSRAAKIMHMGGILTLGIPLLIGKCLESMFWPIILTLCVPVFICEYLKKRCWLIITKPLHFCNLLGRRYCPVFVYRLLEKRCECLRKRCWPIIIKPLHFCNLGRRYCLGFVYMLREKRCVNCNQTVNTTGCITYKDMFEWRTTKGRELIETHHLI